MLQVVEEPIFGASRQDVGARGRAKRNGGSVGRLPSLAIRFRLGQLEVVVSVREPLLRIAITRVIQLPELLRKLAPYEEPASRVFRQVLAQCNVAAPIREAYEIGQSRLLEDPRWETDERRTTESAE